jgi:hypothetical protein
MQVYNRYLVSLAIVILASATVMVGLNAPLKMHYTVYLGEVLIVTELYRHFNQRARKALLVVSLGFFGVFLITTALQVVEILA